MCRWKADGIVVTLLCFVRFWITFVTCALQEFIVRDVARIEMALALLDLHDVSSRVFCFLRLFQLVRCSLGKRHAVPS